MVAFSLVIIVWGIAITSFFQYALQTILTQQGLDKSVVENIAKHFTTISTGLTIACVSIVLFIVVLLSKTITRPIEKLTRGVMDVARGKLDVRIDTVSQDELGQLAEGFNLMTGQIKDSLRKIELAKEYADNIVATIPSILIVLNNRLNILSANKTFKELPYLLTLEQFVIPLEAEIRECLETGESLKKEIVLIPEGSGTSLVFLAVVSQIRIPEEEMVGVLLTITDITERKRAHETLKKSEEHLRNVLDGLGPYMLVGLMTPEGILIEANRSALEIAGLKSEDVLGKPFEETYWWSYSEPVKQQLRDAIRRATRGETCRYDVDVCVGENRFITIDFCLHPLADETGKIIYLIPSAVNITERKRAEEELRKHREHLEELVEERTAQLREANIRLQELDRLKSMFIASMSHELRTPLNSIIGFTGIILQGMAGEITEEQRKQLTMVKNSADHLLALINDIIDLSKIEAGKAELVIEEFDLSSLLQEVKDSFKVAATEKGLKVSLQMPKRLVVESDERKVKQVLMNFVSNAVKFTQEGEIKIKLAKKDGMVEISVKDTGIGIRKEHMDRLFKAFSQIPVEGRPKEGTGLGLYLSKKITNLLGGETSAESECGRGSEFVFTLPLKHKEVKT
jgi:PAS domain S-box-containing protein